MASTQETILLILGYWIIVLLIFYPISKKISNLKLSPLMIMYRKEAGFSFFDKLKGNSIFNVTLWISILITLFSMLLFYYFIGNIALTKLSGVSETGGLVPIIPGITIRGTAIIYILISIGIAATIHELSHAAASKSLGIPIKSTGVILAIILPAAFVEPDEKMFSERPLKDKAKVLSAGPASNFLLGLLLLAILSGIYSFSNGVEVISVSEDSLAQEAGIEPGLVIQEINGQRVKNIADLQQIMNQYKNKDALLTIKGHMPDGSEKTIEIYKPKEADKIGITIREAKAFESMPDQFYFPLINLLSFSYIINISLAIINAAPLFITDGGRMLSEFLVEKIGKIRGKTIGFFIQILTLFLVISSLTFTPIG